MKLNFLQITKMKTHRQLEAIHRHHITSTHKVVSAEWVKGLTHKVVIPSLSLFRIISHILKVIKGLK